MHQVLVRAVMIGLVLIGAGLVISPASRGQVKASRNTYYVRQTVGDDANDGLSAKTAWQHISKLSAAMKAGDTAYVGPGLYREEISVRNEGSAQDWLTFIADTTGEHTGDPPGVVMVAGAEPLDENIFVPHTAAGVYMARFPAYPVQGVVEMDGDQDRYNRVTQTREYLTEKMPAVDVVAKFPSSYYYDEKEKVLYIHTSDGNPPSSHEIEIIRRLNGISMVTKHFVTIIGFTFRHMGDAGINFFEGSGYAVAMNNTAYGNRQGIRVLYAQNILIYGNTLFRNENAGVYFLRESTNGAVVRNVLYENIKGVRWGSKSVDGVAIDNTAFDNREVGISIEDTNQTTLMGNRLVNNRKSQLLVLQSEYASAGNCFENGSPEQLTADFYPFPPTGRYKTLAEYQRETRRDVDSREGGCGPLPAKIDVRRLHAETTAYAERARKMLAGPGDTR